MQLVFLVVFFLLRLHFLISEHNQLNVLGRGFLLSPWGAIGTSILGLKILLNRFYAVKPSACYVTTLILLLPVLGKISLEVPTIMHTPFVVKEQ